MAEQFDFTIKDFLNERKKSDGSEKDGCSVNFKLDYMIRLFWSIRNKPFESYVIQRIWHRLDDERVYFVTQQYFSRQKTYALADLYLPQLNLIIEVDEPYHSQNAQQKKDCERTRDIQQACGAEIRRISMCKVVDGKAVCCSLAEVNCQIDTLVVEIKQRINGMGCAFRPWFGAGMFSTQNHIYKGYLSVYENDYVHTIKDATAIFGAKVKNRGFLWPAAFDVPGKQDEMVWFPSVNSRDWSNVITPDGKMIYEYYKKGEPMRSKHVRLWIKENKKRITFLKMKNAMGLNEYWFVGVFIIDPEESLKENKCVWRRIDVKYILNNKNLSLPVCPWSQKDILF